ncbi:MAG: beta-ketoacyl-ACP synthase II [Chloroflexi bacterium]|jgi:3-oxoacyl-[acyl-carrier-protein] synthase II|nr:beta-ketoacyl-ACP synthase II [Chloroflexota bacterium]MBT3669375.1 beta-ketoacyl-ACP synthase II [Chloroflexota bacterium]MBT4001827.1 beta-ketoacyl-ACP synthase II [Chloroflexota bacterium]MBT4304606.1 beta-ketoacyl-ACP synthase II [Chloroflexota bacterium]MBT4534053.1 beta-ketoacyl-ACP synthase II [Chloroflexota bacterium]
MEKIVITGTGAISSIGLGTEENWNSMLNGVSGVGPITLFNSEDFLVKIACEVKGFDPSEHISGRSSRRRDRFQQFSSVAVTEAIEHSGLELDNEDPGRIGAIISTGIGGLGTIEENIAKMHEGGPRKVSPFLIPMLMSNGASGMAGIDHGFQGPAFSVASACASGQDGIGVAWMMLRSGMVDVAIAGGSESTITPLGVAAFDRIGACSRRGVEEGTPSPFDLNRDGLVVGEGAGIVVLETESHAKNRGATILAELAGYGATADANHITAPSEDGVGGSKAMTNALNSAGIDSSEVQYVNAHGTGTPLNDAAETQGIKSAFGAHASKLMVSSTKSMTGHMMGATGALETVMLTNIVQKNQVPPTINYATPDPVCDLDYVPNEARDAKVDVAITNAFGFGGHNTVLVVKKYS